MIPRTIHYCWFGHNPKPKLAEKCIKSWKRHCKGYEIIEWNEENFDISSAPLYVRQAYEAKKWAFVTDYVRLWAMVNYGGIYMDTDVEVKKPLDRFLEHKAFSGFEDHTSISTGIMACEKDYPLFCELLDEYSDISFINEDGSYNITTNVVRITNACKLHGFQPNNELQTIDGFTLYPNEYFCPKDYATGKINKTQNTYTIHHFTASWQTEKQKRAHLEDIKRKEKMERYYKRRNRMDVIIHTPNRIVKKIIGEKKYNLLKSKFKG